MLRAFQSLSIKQFVIYKINNRSSAHIYKIYKMEYLTQIFAKFFGAGDGSSHGRPPKVIAFGNILLDRAVKLNNAELLERYQISIGSREEIDVETLQKLTAEAIQIEEPAVNPGGSASNTARILQKLGTDVDFYGAVGKDSVAEELKNVFKVYKVNARLQTVDDAPTGLCICLIYKDDVSCLANIGASAKFSVEHLKAVERDNTQAFLRPLERKQILYIEGFFIPHREDVCDYIVKNYIHGRRRLAINLSSVSIVQQHFDKIMDLAKEAFFIFGNKAEFDALVEKMDIKKYEEMGNILLKNNKIPKIIVITNRDEELTLLTNYIDEYSEPGEISFQTFHANKIENVVDATGAGDSFVAGFLHAWLEKRSLTECVRMGMDVAADVCTQMGCNLPESYNGKRQI